MHLPIYYIRMPKNMNIFFNTYFYIIEKECIMNVLFAMGFICPVLDKCRWLIRHHRYAHIIFPLLENPWKRWCDQARMYDIAEVHTWWWFVDVALLHFHLCKKRKKDYTRCCFLSTRMIGLRYDCKLPLSARN